MAENPVLSLFHERLQSKLSECINMDGEMVSTLLHFGMMQIREGLTGPDNKLSSYINAPPDGCRDFIAMCGAVFSADFCECMESRIAGFNILVGGGGKFDIADAFIQECSRFGWLEEILKAIHHVYLYPTSKDTGIAWRKFPFGLDGNGGTGQAGVQQIMLTGADLKEAWVGHPTTRTWHPPTSTFTPEHHGGPMVFHGSRKFGDVAPPTFPSLVEGRVVPAGAGNQMAPWGVFHTSFHGVRAFLWAFFQSGVATPKLEPSVLKTLNAPFYIDGTAYRGVLVVAFYTHTPSPPALNAEILDQGHIRSWGDECLRNSQPMPDTANEKNEIWTQMAHLHNKASTVWPDILHAPEYEDMRRALAGFNGSHNDSLLPRSGPLWRSAHCTYAATRELRAHFHQAFAIALDEDSLESKIPTTTKTPASTDGDNKKKGHLKTMTRKFATWGRKMHFG